jgi:hypothetical protein
LPLFRKLKPELKKRKLEMLHEDACESTSAEEWARFVVENRPATREINPQAAHRAPAAVLKLWFCLERAGVLRGGVLSAQGEREWMVRQLSK